MPAIPIIDVGAAIEGRLPLRRAAAREIGAACRDTGFFYVRNHGIPQRLIAAQLEAARRFFALPLADKLTLDMRKSPCNRGYEAMGGQTLDTAAPPDLKEGYYIGLHLEPDHPLVRAGLPNHGPNVWPADLAGFREQCETYQARMLDLARRLAGLVALSLDLAEEFFEPALETPMVILRLLHYPPHPTGAPANQLGAGTHTDWGLITLLAQDDCGGLEVRHAGGGWLQADPIPGTFVVNIGDMLQRWTNDRYRSTPHRVRNDRSGRDRYSIPFFVDPGYRTRVECLPGCCAVDDPPRHPPCSAGEHIAEMYRRTYGA